MNEVNVIKRDGTKELFDENKICRVLGAAGMPSEEANLVVKNVVSWIESNKLQEFTSLQLRDAILEQLTQINPQVADLYQWYESTKDQH